MKRGEEGKEGKGRKVEKKRGREREVVKIMLGTPSSLKPHAVILNTVFIHSEKIDEKMMLLLF